MFFLLARFDTKTLFDVEMENGMPAGIKSAPSVENLGLSTGLREILLMARAF